MSTLLFNSAFAGAMLVTNAVQAKTVEEELTGLDRAMQKALVDRDPVAFGSFLTDDYILVVSNSGMYGKKEVVADITSPNTKFSLNESSNLDIRVYKNTAMVIADLHQVFMRDSKPFDYWVRFTDTWIQKDGKWLCWSGHATLLKKD